MNVLIIGDVIIDRYTHGTRRGISAETPTIVANLKKEEMFVGGAGLVTRNLLRLGDTVTLLTVGANLIPHFRGSTDPITPSEATRLEVLDHNPDGWIVSEKRRYFVEQYKLLQYDLVNSGSWTSFAEDTFVRSMRRVMVGKDAVVVCDNRHGVMSEHIAKQTVREALTKQIPIYIDSQVSQTESNHEWYKGADFVFLNEFEADCVAKKFKCDPKRSQLGQISNFLKSNIVYKRGERGAITVPFTKHKEIISQGFEVDAVDTCGAGDSFLAAFVHHDRDLEAANRWAALSTTYKGTIVPKVEDLEKVTR